MQYKFYIDYNGLGYIEAYPDNIAPFPLVIDKSNKKITQNFIRSKWGALQISNNPYLFNKTTNEAYRLFDQIYGSNFSQKILVKHVTDLETTYGYFGRNDCTFDFDRKILTVKPAIIDEVTNILENWENEVDFNNYEFNDNTVTIEITNSTLKTVQDWPSIMNSENQWPRNRVKEKDYDSAGGIDAYFDGQKPKYSLLSDSYWGFSGLNYISTLGVEQGAISGYVFNQRISILGETPTYDEFGKPLLTSVYGDYELSGLRVYEGTRMGGLSGKRWRQLYLQTWFSRDEIIKVDVIDSEAEWGFEPPVGDGWHIREVRKSEGKNAHLWTRVPFNGAYSNAWELQPEVGNDGSRDYAFNWYKQRETKLTYDNTKNSFKLTTTIKLKDFLNYLIKNTSEELAGMEVKSTFFFNDDEGALPVLSGTTGYNYVTGAKNHLNDIEIFFTRDLLSIESNDIKNIPKFTLSDILDDFNKTFVNTLMWFVEGTYIRVEHIRYRDLKRVTLDLTDSSFLNFTSEWDYDKSNMFERFEYNQINSGYIDFTNNIVTFDKIVSNNRSIDLKSITKTEITTTDAKYCVLNPNDVQDGLIMLIIKNNIVSNKVGIISKVVETNGFLSLSNILQDFGRYEGVWHTGIINGAPATFTTTPRNKIGIELILSGTKKSLFYVTQLGIGILEDGLIDYENENTKITLRYRYNSSVNGDLFVLAFQKKENFVGAKNIWADIDNFIAN